MEYLSAHVLTCLVPAFFIAGAIAVFISQGSVLRYFGAQANKVLSYGVASVSGTVLAVCSCTVLPLFAGIYKRGAGLGPAIAFLYSGPAINLLAIVYTARVLGWELGFARAVGSVVFSILIGLVMALLFRRKEEAQETVILPAEARSAPKTLAFFFALIAILLVGTARIGTPVKLAGVMALIGGVGLMSVTWFERWEIQEWLRETWNLARKIFPLLLAGVFVAGALKVLLPPQWVAAYVGANTVSANLLASVLGALMYFSTLTEVPIIHTLMGLGMGRGPALALLLAGPALSLPSMLVIGGVMGARKTAAYALLVILTASFTGMMFGSIVPG